MGPSLSTASPTASLVSSTASSIFSPARSPLPRLPQATVVATRARPRRIRNNERVLLREIWERLMGELLGQGDGDKVTRTGGSPEAEDQGNHEDHQENEEDHFRDSRGCGGDAREPENSCDECNHKKRKS